MKPSFVVLRMKPLPVVQRTTLVVQRMKLSFVVLRMKPLPVVQRTTLVVQRMKLSFVVLRMKPLPVAQRTTLVVQRMKPMHVATQLPLSHTSWWLVLPHLLLALRKSVLRTSCHIASAELSVFQAP